MPRGDGTGPWGTGSLGRGHGGFQPIGFGYGFGRGLQGNFGFANNTPAIPEALELQAERLETQAAYLRNIAKQKQKTE